jgi:CxxC motif-containing protein (DUF1111 family)
MKRCMCVPCLLATIVVGHLSLCRTGSADDGRPGDIVVARGAELFARDWLPGDRRSHGGDGLGPVYNETSCIACHHQGGAGGAGPVSTNVEILNRGDARAPTRLHPGFRASGSVLLHRFGVDPKYQAWRFELLDKGQFAKMLGAPETEIQMIQQMIEIRSVLSDAEKNWLVSGLRLSQRNPPALFGVGLIDTVSDRVLSKLENTRYAKFPDIHGRANWLEDGRVGRFGWKAGVPTLREFAVAACANELGLEVPDHHQAPSPLDPQAKAEGLDLTRDECEALVAYLRQLPAPTSHQQDAVLPAVAQGRSLFEFIGCATCHVPKLGPVEGIYSDLLLHDMGPSLSDQGDYYEKAAKDSSIKPATSREWRTPPLWGFRDSGPYLHDGRADNLEQAVAFHGGEAIATAKLFFQLSARERLQIQMFLRAAK